MCAIVDANVARDVFQPGGTEAGKKFFEWLNGKEGSLVVGGRARIELFQLGAVQKWAQQAQLSGKVKIEDEVRVDQRTAELEDEGNMSSDDPHVIALAQISGARLLYSNDRDLQEDFKCKELIDNPRGKVYSTLVSPLFSIGHKRLLANKRLCRTR